MNFANAVAAGYGIEQILEFVTKTYPEIGRKIREARNIGYDVNQIFKMIEKMTPNDLQKQESKGVFVNNNPYINADRKQRQSSAFEKVGKYAPAAAKLSAMYALSTMVPWGSLLTNATSVLPKQPQSPGPTPSPMQQTPGQAIGQDIQQGQQPGQIPQLPGPTPNQPSGPTPGQPPVQPITQEQINNAPEYQPEFDFLKRKNLVPKIQSMVKAGKSKEQIVEMLKKKMPMMEQETLRALGPGGREVDLDTKLGKIVDRFFSPTSQLPESTKSVEKPIEVGSEVITPSGDIAKIDILPGKTAKVDVDGKKQVFETKTLTPVPENKEEILSIYDKLISSIPEEARSSMVAAMGYDPERNKVSIKFHDGTSYNYDDLDQEDIDSILQLEHLAKTTGGNYFGVYFEGEPSLGAGVSKLIQRLQKKYGGKGKEYSGKFKEVYSLYAIPEGLNRERQKKEREERKRAKRNA